ncbi:hypothetical protein MRB53_035704 [Persea americana]|uniref:Uncharacterized protein n=1 Tax=Persea americana TaxID=3435 RepID=A0ACC2K5E9_PERAE|nr:hypothetical protein MRB53_035704 [Persea americana]
MQFPAVSADLPHSFLYHSSVVVSIESFSFQEREEKSPFKTLPARTLDLPIPEAKALFGALLFSSFDGNGAYIDKRSNSSH